MNRSAVILVGCMLATTTPIGVARTATASAMADAGDREHLERGNALKLKGEEHQAVGAHAEAARAYAAAFDAFAQRVKPDAKETRMVSLAVDEFGLAQRDAPEDIGLYEEEAALLDRFAERNDDIPQEFIEERARVKERIDALTAKQAEAKQAEAEQRNREAETKATQPEQGQAEPWPEPQDPASAVPNPRSRREAAAIVGAGVAAIMGGMTLVGAGAWTLGAADERRDARLAELDANEYPNEDGIRNDLVQWHQRGRGIGTGLVVSGVVVAAAGIGLTAWGVVKLRRAGKRSGTRASVVLPMADADGVGVVVRGAF